MEKRRLCNTASSTEVESGKKNFQLGDIALVRDDTIRNAWPMARILKTFNNKEGLVHSVQLVIGKNSSNSKEISVFERPVNKLVLLVENEHN